jgi:hypothetical protein
MMDAGTVPGVNMHRRIARSGPSPAPPRTRTMAVRPGRLTAAGLTAVAVATVLLLVWAAAAQASVWVIPAMARAYPSTKADARQSIAIDAAGNEYQGVQLCLRGGDRKVRISWSADSDPLLVDNAKLFRVFYVKVTTPTTKLGSRAGWYPDPLVPRDFGAVQNVPGSVNPGPTTPFYVLVHVPLGTPAGTYTGTLEVEEDGSLTASVPFSLRVWDFGWSRISTRSAFAMSQDNLKRSLPRNFTFDGQNKAEVLRNFYTMMKQHGISPTVVHYLPKVTDSGNAAEGDWADKVAPFLDETDGAVGIQDNQLPFLRFFPWSRSERPSSTAILNYLTQMTRAYKDRGWHKKAYVYILDETTKRSEELQAERYARLAHKASARSGYRIKFLLTDDPRPHSLGGVKTANTFLYDDVDIWTLRYYYFFGRIPAVRERQQAGKDIWWYSYVNDSVRKTPSFVIDKPHIDSRVWGWMMEKWDVDGILNWGFNRWGKPASGDGWRDPYRNPLSLIKGDLRSNGDTSLVYPGYYPRYGLDRPTAAPVSSLRLEALRDGLEEREYLRIAKTLPGGATQAAAALKTIITWVPKVRQANVFEFPVYTGSNTTFDAARKALAEFIEAQQPL